MDVKCFVKTVVSCSLQAITVLAAPYILFLSLFYLFIPLSFFSPQHSLLFRVCSHFLETLPTSGPALLSPVPVLVWQRRMSCVQPCQITQPLPVHATSPLSLQSGLSASVNHLPLQSYSYRLHQGFPMFAVSWTPYSQNYLPVPLFKHMLYNYLKYFKKLYIFMFKCENVLIFCNNIMAIIFYIVVLLLFYFYLYIIYVLLFLILLYYYYYYTITTTENVVFNLVILHYWHTLFLFWYWKVAFTQCVLLKALYK